MKILAIYSSPRIPGNSTYLLDFFLNYLKSKKTDFKIKKIKKMYLYALNFKGCKGCNHCATSQVCILKDDFSKKILPELNNSNLLLISFPVYFYSHPSGLQKFFERFQIFWLNKKKVRFKNSIKGVLLGIGGTRGKKLFDATQRSFKYVLSTINGVYLGGIFLRRVEKEKDLFLKKEEILKEIERLTMHFSEYKKTL